MLGGAFTWLLRRREAACRRCPHDRSSHQPYVPGGDRPGYCAARTGAGACRCWQYKPEQFWTLALAFLRERPEPVQVDVLRPRPVPFPIPDWCKDDDDWDEHRTRLGFRAAPYAPRPRKVPPC